MSRVYSEKVIADVTSGTADYIWQFFGALAQTRIPVPGDASFGGTALDYLLNVYGTSDPYLPEEVAITQSWSNWLEWKSVDSALHQIPSSFQDDWPPPAQWAQSVDWNPLSQSSGRVRLFGSYRTRRH